MIRSIFLFTVWAGVMVCMPLCEMSLNGAEMLANGNFELEDNGFLACWQPGATIDKKIPNNIQGIKNSKSETYTWDSISHGDGKGSLKMEALEVEGKPSGIVTSGKIIARPETEYRLSYWYKGEGLSPFDAQHRDCVLVVDVFYQTDAKFLGNKRDYVPTNASDWTQRSMTFKTAAGTEWIQVRLQLASTVPNHKAGIWFDDITLEPVDRLIAVEAPAVGGFKQRTSPSVVATSPNGTSKKSSALDIEIMNPDIPYGSKMQRTMKLLATSTPDNRHRVRILFYGQSIIAQDWWKPIVADLKKRYPNADIVAENPSIGGFTAVDLKDTCESDLYPFYPDLVVFHDYGDKENFEIIYSELKKRTTSETLTLTHHIAAEKGWLRGQDAESDIIRELAAKYGYEVAEIRKNWYAHLAKNKLEPKEFLKDVIHLNAFGEELMCKLVISHFAYIPDAKPYWNDMYQIFTSDGKRWTPGKDEYPSGGAVISSPLKIEFEGNRIDLLAMASKDTKLGTAKILIDGKEPSKYPEIYAFKRFNSFNHWQPVLRRIQIGGNPPVEEEWTLTFTKISPGAKDFEYEVKGSVTGADGRGTRKEKFVSNSGRITIDPQWFHLEKICKMVKKTPDVGFSIKTKVYPVGVDTWAPKAAQNPSAEDFYTIAQGLKNEKHTLTIIPNGDGPLPLRSFIVYKPSLRGE